MDRRKFNSQCLFPLAAGLMLGPAPAGAVTWSALSDSDAARALKTALEHGARQAVLQLGRTDGFLGNAQVKILLPDQLRSAEPLLRRFGQGDRLDELVVTMNRAAEAAVPMAQELMLQAVRSMTVHDAKGILAGGDTSVTAYFSQKTRQPLAVKFLPVVSKATRRVGLARQYDELAGKAADLGLLRREDASVDHHVTRRALDGLYLVVGEEERKIRRDPIGTGSALLAKVFGAIH